MTTFDNSEIKSGSTIGGDEIQEITIDGTVTWTALEPVTTTFNYTGSVQTYTIPDGYSTLEMKIKGAQGNSAFSSAGKGGVVEGSTSVNSGDTLYIYVGGSGGSPSGGWPNGGNGEGGVSFTDSGGSGSYSTGGGGGSSEIRVNDDSRGNNLLAVAGGGGGGTGSVGDSEQKGGGGHGGANWGQDGGGPYNGTGGTQTYGGSTGGSGWQGGNSQSQLEGNPSHGAGGGGGGYYGGGGGGGNGDDAGGGGGGSNYVGNINHTLNQRGGSSGNGSVEVTIVP